MAKKYPNISGIRRRPNKDRDGSKNYGKPCVICSQGSVGEKWVQFSYMRGDDETVRVCAEHWNVSDSEILENMYKQEIKE